MPADVEEIEDCTCIRETRKACLIRVPGTGKAPAEVWVPKSVIHDDSEVYKEGDRGTLIVARWFAEKEGLG
jgi:hypothetical protein